jgi:hypothetical protein
VELGLYYGSECACLLRQGWEVVIVSLLEME